MVNTFETNKIPGEEIEEILTKNIQVELSRIRMLLFVIAFVLILEFLL
jgi:S-adenosylmethionine synthetase